MRPLTVNYSKVQLSRILPFTLTSIGVELSSPPYFELVVPNDPRRLSPPDDKVEVAVRIGQLDFQKSLCYMVDLQGYCLLSIFASIMTISVH
jgi:hypothetical protein